MDPTRIPQLMQAMQAYDADFRVQAAAIAAQQGPAAMEVRSGLVVSLIVGVQAQSSKYLENMAAARAALSDPSKPIPDFLLPLHREARRQAWGSRGIA